MLARCARYIHIGILACGFFLLAASSVDAAYLYLEPSTKTVKPNEEFEVLVKINTEGERPTTTDSLIEFDSNNLTIIDVVRGSETEEFFPEMIKRISGKTIYIGSYIRLGSQPKSGEGLIAKLRFKGTKEAQSYVKLLCTINNTTDSNISLKRDRKVVDAIDCSKVINGTYIVSSGGPVPTPTPTISTSPVPTVTGAQATPTLVPSATPTLIPTSTPAATPSATTYPTPSVLPETGVFQTTGMVIGVGIVLTIISILIKIYVS
jgi:hypothetical protein